MQRNDVAPAPYAPVLPPIAPIPETGASTLTLPPTGRATDEKPTLTNVSGTVALIKASLEKMPPDIDTVVEIIRSLPPEQAALVRQAFRERISGGRENDTIVENFIDGLNTERAGGRELLRAIFCGNIAELDAQVLSALLTSVPAGADANTASQMRAMLRGKLGLELGDNGADVERRIEAFNRSVIRRESLEHWLRDEIKDPEMLKRFKEWETLVAGAPGTEVLLIDGWLKKNLTATQRASFERFAEARAATTPSPFVTALKKVFGDDTRFMDWVDARKAGNAPLAEAAMLVELVRSDDLSSRDLMFYLLTKKPDDVAGLARAYAAKFGKPGDTDIAQPLFEAVTKRKPGSEDALSAPLQLALKKLLGGTVIDRGQLEVDLAATALGFKQGMKEGTILDIRAVELNGLLQGKNAEEVKDLFARLERHLSTMLVPADGQARTFVPDPKSPGRALVEYLAKYSDRPSEEIRVLTVKSATSDLLRANSYTVASQARDRSERERAASAINQACLEMEKERREFYRAEESLRRGERVELPALRHFDVTKITTLDRRREWANLVQEMVSRGQLDSANVAEYVLNLKRAEHELAPLSVRARALGGDVSSMLVGIQGASGNVLYGYRQFDREIDYGWRTAFIGGAVHHLCGTRKEALRGIKQDEDNTQRKIFAYLNSEEGIRTSLAEIEALAKKMRDAQQAANLALLQGRKGGDAQKASVTEMLDATNKAIDARRLESKRASFQANQMAMHELQEASVRLGDLDRALEATQKTILKAGVVVAGVVVCVGTGGMGVPLVGAVLLGTGVGFGGSMLGRNYLAAANHKQTMSKEVMGEVLDDTVDVFIACASAGSGGGLTARMIGKTGTATGRQVFGAHVAGNVMTNTMMFGGNTAKNYSYVHGVNVPVVGIQLYEGKLKEQEREKGRALTDEERQKIFEEHRLTLRALAVDGGTYLVTALAGGGLSGLSHARSGTFQMVAGKQDFVTNGNAVFWNRVNTFGQIGVGFGGNGLYYLYKEAGIEKDYHFDAGLLIAPLGNIMMAPKVRNNSSTVSSRRTPAGHAATEPVTVAPREQPPSQSAARRTACLHEASALEARANAAATEPAVANAYRKDAAGKRAEAARHHLDESHANLSDAKKSGNAARILDAEEKALGAQKAALEAEGEHLRHRAAAGEDVKDAKAKHDKRLQEHLDDRSAWEARRAKGADPVDPHAKARGELDEAQKAVSRAESELARARAGGEPGEMFDPKRKETVRAKEDAVAAARARALDLEHSQIVHELGELPPTLKSADRRSALLGRLQKLEARRAQLEHHQTESNLNRARTDAVERQMADPKKGMTEAEIGARRDLMQRELDARGKVAEQKVADARALHGDDSHPAVKEARAELAQIEAAKGELGTAQKPGRLLEAELARHKAEVTKTPLERAQALHDAIVERFGPDASKWPPDVKENASAAWRIRQRAIERDGKKIMQADREAAEKQLAYEKARDQKAREALGLKDSDPLPPSRKAEWGEESGRKSARVEEALSPAKGKGEEKSPWKTRAKVVLAGGVIGYGIWSALKEADRAGQAITGLIEGYNDDGYMFGRSDDGGPIDEVIFSRMLKAQTPAEYLDIARTGLREHFGTLLSEADFERYAKMMIRDAKPGVPPSQLRIKDVVTEAESVATDGESVRRWIFVPKGREEPPAPRHGEGGFFDIERLKAEGAIPQNR